MILNHYMCPMRFIKPSTLAFFREARNKKNYPVREWLHGYIYAVFTYAYIGNGMGELKPARVYLWLLKQWRRVFPAGPAQPAKVDAVTFADTYHGKVVPLQTARELISVRENVQAAYPEQVIPYKLARELVLNQPDHIVLLDCPCRSARENPCQPLDVCLIVGEPFASMVVEHHPKRSRWVNREEALQVIESEHARGHVQHAFFKEAMLGRFYAICNCCSCCCGAMQAHRSGTPMLASSGYLCRVDESLCAGCGACEEICPFDAIQVDGAAVVDEARCMGCGVCVSHCPTGGLELTLAPHRGIPLQVPVK